MGVTTLPQIADLMVTIWGLGLVYTTIRIGLMKLTSVTASDQIISTMAESLLLIDPNGKIVLSNQAMQDLLEIRENDLKGTEFKMIVAEKGLAEDILEETQRAGRSLNRKIHYKSKNGKLIPVLLSSSVIRDKMHALVGFVVMARDISEIVAAEIQLRTQKELIDRILACEPNAVMVVNKDHHIVLANSSFYNMFNQQKDGLEGRSVEDILGVKELNDLISAALGGKADRQQIEFKFKQNNYDKFVVASVIDMEKEEILVILSDITEARERQAKLCLNERLVSVGEMASGVAHELNNPLTSVIGLSQLLLNEEVPQAVKEDLEAIYSEARRAAAIVKNLLTFARKHAPERQLTQINTIMEDVLKLRAYEHKVNNIQVQAHLDPQLPQVMVDNFQMQQVFLNLILNVEYAMSQAHSRGTLTIASERANGGIKISCQDDGPGVSVENMKHLFNPFFTTKEVGKGTGLGLSICYGIIAGHGGRIYAESQEGRGATFVVELPVASSQGEFNITAG
jgi:two-component system, NtrC family, sensor kinase